MPPRIEEVTAPAEGIDLIVADLDRTTLTHDYRLLPEVVSAFQVVRDAGLKTAIATARSYAGLAPWAELLGVSGPCVCLNGAWVGSTNGQEHASFALEPGVTRSLLDEAKRLGMEPVWFTAGQTHAYAITAAVEREARATGQVASVSPEGPVASEGPIYKVLLTTSDSAAVADLKAQFASRLLFAHSNRDLIEVTGPGVSKGRALDLLADLYGTDVQRTAAIGDSENDISMLSTAGFGVAMGNASSSVRRAAQAEAPDVEVGGLAVALTCIAAWRPTPTSNRKAAHV